MEEQEKSKIDMRYEILKGISECLVNTRHYRNIRDYPSWINSLESFFISLEFKLDENETKTCKAEIEKYSNLIFNASFGYPEYNRKFLIKLLIDLEIKLQRLACKYNLLLPEGELDF